MILDRQPYDPATVRDFYETALATLGAVCERPWHDRLEVLAEGSAARLWNEAGELHAGELAFLAPDAPGERDAARHVFPGCPLTFRLAEAVCPAPPPLERVVLTAPLGAAAAAPSPEVAEKLWRAQFPDTARWHLATPFTRDHHFSLVALARCEIQAIDQQWALARATVNLVDGTPDDSLAASFGSATADPRPSSGLQWPTPEPARWKAWLRDALAHDLAPELAKVRRRQQHRLAHEWARIDQYFENYATELGTRAARSTAKAKLADRLAAAKAEQARHRADQVARHEIVVLPRIDALLLVAEPVWRATIGFVRDRETQTLPARYLPRARRWVVLPPAATWIPRTALPAGRASDETAEAFSVWVKSDLMSELEGEAPAGPFPDAAHREVRPPRLRARRGPSCRTSLRPTPTRPSAWRFNLAALSCDDKPPTRAGAFP